MEVTQCHLEVFMEVKGLSPYKDLYNKLSFYDQLLFWWGGVSWFLG